MEKKCSDNQENVQYPETWPTICKSYILQIYTAVHTAINAYKNHNF